GRGVVRCRGGRSRNAGMEVPSRPRAPLQGRGAVSAAESPQGRARTATVLTPFPEMFPGPLGQSLARKALAVGHWALETVDIRDFARDKHATVDDSPFGGGPGMVMRPDVVDAALASLPADERPKVFLTPRGKLLDQARIRELAEGPGVAL